MEDPIYTYTSMPAKSNLIAIRLVFMTDNFSWESRSREVPGFPKENVIPDSRSWFPGIPGMRLLRNKLTQLFLLYYTTRII